MPRPSGVGPRRLRVLVVDDDALVLKALARMLRSVHEVWPAACSGEAIPLVQRFSIEAIISDYELGPDDDHDGLSLLRMFALPGVLLTGHLIEDDDYPVLRKPVLRENLLQALDEVAGAGAGSSST